MWNFKGTLWNSTQNSLPIHWKIWFLYNIAIIRALRFKSSYAFWNAPCFLIHSVGIWVNGRGCRVIWSWRRQQFIFNRLKCTVNMCVSPPFFHENSAVLNVSVGIDLNVELVLWAPSVISVPRENKTRFNHLNGKFIPVSGKYLIMILLAHTECPQRLYYTFSVNEKCKFYCRDLIPVDGK